MTATVRTSMDYTWFIKGTVRHDGTTLDAFGGDCDVSGVYHFALSNSEEILFSFNCDTVTDSPYFFPEALHAVFNHAFRVIDPSDVPEVVKRIRSELTRVNDSNYINMKDELAIEALKECGKSVAGIALLMKLSVVSQEDDFETIQKAAINHFDSFKSKANSVKNVTKFLDPKYMRFGENTSGFFDFFENLPTKLAKTESSREFIHLLYSAIADEDNNNTLLSDVQPCEIRNGEKCDKTFLNITKLYPLHYKSVCEYLLTQKVCDVKLLIGRIHGDSSEETTLVLSKAIIGAQLEPLAALNEKSPALAHATYNAVVELLPSSDNISVLASINNLLLFRYRETWKLQVANEWLSSLSLPNADFFGFGKQIHARLSVILDIRENEKWLLIDDDNDLEAVDVLIELMAHKMSSLEVMAVIQRVYDEKTPLTFQQWLNFIDDPSVCESTPVSWWGEIL